MAAKQTRKQKQLASRQQAPKKVEQKRIDRKQLLIWLVPIMAVTLFALYPCVNNEMVFWDDPEYTTRNPFIEAPVGEIFSNYYFANYHPLTLTVYKWLHSSFEFEPGPYHTFNLLMHLANTALVFLFIYLLLDKRQLITPALCAIVFGVHPLHVESVVWISELKDVLYSFFFLLGLVCYTTYVKDTQSKKWLLLAFPLFLLSCFSKAAAVTLPVVFFLVDYLQKRKFSMGLVLEKVPFLAVSVVFGVLSLKAQGTEGAINPDFYEGGRNIIWGFYSLSLYLVKFLAPTNLSGIHPYPVGDTQGDPPSIALGMTLIALAFLVLLFLTRKKGREWLFGGAFFLVTIFLVLKFLPVGDAIIGERYTYIPYIGLAFVVGQLLQRGLSAKKLTQPVAIGLLAVVGLASAFVSNARTKVWKDNQTFWGDVVEKYPNYWRGHNQLGEGYYQAGQLDLAIQKYSDAINMDPYAPPIPYLWRGALYIDQATNYEQAIADCQKSMEMSHSQLEDTWTDAKQNMGLAYHRLGQYDVALQHYNELLSIAPNRSKTYYLRGLTYQRKGENEAAVQDFGQAIQLNPNDHQPYLNRGVIFTDQLARYDEAIADFTRVLQLDPSVLDAAINIGLANYKKGQYDVAIQQYSNILAQQQNPRIIYLRALAYAAKGDFTKALADGQQAQQLGYQVDPNLLNTWRQ